MYVSGASITPEVPLLPPPIIVYQHLPSTDLLNGSHTHDRGLSRVLGLHSHAGGEEETLGTS